jgi:protein tyrosine/serine phosphatase
MTLLEKVENFLFKNMGVEKIVPANIVVVRSGQPGFIRRWIIYKLTKFKSIINLADSTKDDQDSAEKKWAESKGFPYKGFSWGAGGPPANYDEVNRAVNLAHTLPGPVWIHCEGGKDRTGGFVGIMQARVGISFEKISKDWEPWYGTPAPGWVKAIKAELK